MKRKFFFSTFRYLPVSAAKSSRSLRVGASSLRTREPKCVHLCACIHTHVFSVISCCNFVLSSENFASGRCRVCCEIAAAASLPGARNRKAAAALSPAAHQRPRGLEEDLHRVQ